VRCNHCTGRRVENTVYYLFIEIDDSIGIAEWVMICCNWAVRSGSG
jgi:hypothetical protein